METKTLVLLGILAAIVIVVIGLVSRIRSKAQTDRPGYVYKECASCGWKGQVSKFHKKCSKCGDSLI